MRISGYCKNDHIPVKLLSRLFITKDVSAPLVLYVCLYK